MCCRRNCAPCLVKEDAADEDINITKDRLQEVQADISKEEKVVNALLNPNPSDSDED